ncbi:FHA domain-containing protein [candidate division KSB1 bacterium]|nr:FHA domain-containing protein [candidate division KSB1 bacterium]
MPKLILKWKAEIINEYLLDGKQTGFTIGSDATNDCVINDKKVAPNHLKLELIKGCYYLENLDGNFETDLNGRSLLSRVQIVDGDDIGIGEHNLLFETAATSTLDLPTEDLEVIGEDEIPDKVELDPSKSFNLDETSPVEDITRATSTGSEEFYEIEEFPEDTYTEDLNTSTQEITASVLTAQFPPTKSLYLLAIYGPYIGKKFALNSLDTKIGRDLTLNDIVIRNNDKGVLDPSISRRHATISKKNGNYYISDKRSQTRTYVNQVKLGPTDEIRVHENDEIEIVSDQKSTIFRALAEGIFNPARPQKAGLWWTRNKFRFGVYLSLIFALLMLGALGLSCKMRNAAGNTPDQLKFIEETWYQNESGQGSSPEKSSLALADVTGDGKVDLIFTNPLGHLIALNGVTKETIWSKKHFFVQKEFSIVLADLNMNGLKDVLVVGQDSRLHAFDGSIGAEIWLSPILGGAISGSPIVEDLNGDGLKDVVICSRSGQIHLGYGNIFDLKWQTIETALTINCVPTVADSDNDGIPEIIVGTEEGKVIIVNGSSGIVSRVFDFNEEVSKATGDLAQHSIENPIVIGDLNENGDLDLLIGSASGDFIAFEGSSLKRIWHENLSVENDNTENVSAAFGRFNEDQIDDAVLVSNQMVRVISGSGDPNQQKNILWEHRIGADDFFITPVSLADFNKDNSNEVILASRKGTVFILNGKTGEIISQLYNAENPVISPILVADLGHDSYLDLLFIRNDGNIYKIQSNSPIQENSVVWGQLYNNERNTGNYDFRPPDPFKFDILIATFGCMFLAVGVLTFQSYNSRLKLFSSTKLESSS